MEVAIGSRLKHAWNAFVRNKDPTGSVFTSSGTYYRPDRPRLSRGNERTIVTAVYNRIALDVSLIDIRHVRLDENQRYVEDMKSGLNTCLTLSANADQTGRAFLQDVVLSMFDEGVVAIVPVETDINPDASESYKILSMRTGKITQWYPDRVTVLLYNERKGKKEEVTLPKSLVAIVENPLYAVINEPNSTMQRLVRKLRLLDVIDEQNGSGKLDLIIQLPYVVKTEARRAEAERRRSDIERQLAGSKYGIAYTDGTEKVTQLNRALENNLMGQVEYLTNLLYSQLGLTKEILDGSADEKVMLNYYNRTIRPILTAVSEEMKRKFLTKTARTQGQSVEFFRNPFSLVPVADLAELADKMTRNEVMTANELRQAMGMKPSAEPKADRLQNSNLYQDNGGGDYDSAMAELEGYDAELDELEGMLEQSDEDGDIRGFWMDPEDEALEHYASPYYDPVKAHEYYEQHKQLKGRTSTAGLNDEGKAAARYVKENLNAEKKSRIEASSSSTRAQIDQLREQLSKMSKVQKHLYSRKIRKTIEKLRRANQLAKERLREEYANRIDAEMDRIAGDESFWKPAKEKKSKASKAAPAPATSPSSRGGSLTKPKSGGSSSRKPYGATAVGRGAASRLGEKLRKRTQ